MLNIAKWKILRSLSFLFLFTFIILIIVATIRKDAELYLVLIFPVIKINGPLGAMAVISLILGMVIYFISSIFKGTLNSDNSEGQGSSGSKQKMEWGGVLFIGPIPILIGNSRGRSRFPSWWKMLIAGFILMLFIYLFAILLLPVIL